MRIIVAYKDGEAEKVKGDLVEQLAGHLLEAQHYEVLEEKRNIRTTGVEIDLQCRHKAIKGQNIYVECKAYAENNKIQSGVIDKLIGVRTRKKYTQAWLISTADIGRDAKGIIDELEQGEDADKYAFYTPTKLIDALSSASVIIPENITRQGVINVVHNPKKLGEAWLFITKYGYFWIYEYLRGGEPYGIIYVDAKDGEIIFEKELLDNLAGLKSVVEKLDHKVILDILAISGEQALADDIKNVRLNPLYVNEINDLSIKINHPKMQSLGLKDVWVFPDLEELNDDDQKAIDSSMLTDDPSRRAIIFGNDLSGKTALGKSVQQKLDNEGHVALMLSASEITNRNPQKFEDLLIKKFSHQYGDEMLKVDMFKEALKDNESAISIIIDDFESFGIKRTDWQSEFFAYLRSKYKTILLLADTAVEIEALAKAGTREMLEGFETYKILQLGHVKRDELIHKWISVGGDETVTDDEVLSLKLEISAKINVAVGSNFIPTYPFYVLTMIHLMEDGNRAQTQGTSYADLYNYFITHALIGSGVNPEDLDFYLTYLSYLAHLLLERGVTSLSTVETQEAYKIYVEKMAIDKSYNSVHRLLVNAKILKLDDEIYSFALSYCRYYFTAKYLSDNLDSREIQETVAKITEELYKNENANIVIFLVHHSKNSAIISAIVSQAKRQFEDVLPQTLSKSEMKATNSLIKEEIKFALTEATPEESRKKELIQQDRFENEKGGMEPETILDIFGRVNLAFKTIDVLGQIANNYYGSLDAKSKADIITELYTLGLRGLRAFLDNFDNYVDALRQYLDERIEKKSLQTDTERSNEVDQIIYGFVQLISFAFLKRISDSVSSKNLAPTLDQVVASQSGPAANIIDIAARLNLPKELSKNKDKVENLYKALEKNYLPRDLLKMFVLQHMYKFNINYKDKQSICAQLGINYIDTRNKLKPSNPLKK